VQEEDGGSEKLYIYGEVGFLERKRVETRREGCGTRSEGGRIKHLSISLTTIAKKGV
jgi:hypothetical protein